MEWSNAPLTTILRVAVAAAFAIGGTINLVGRGTVKHDFVRWGNPRKSAMLHREGFLAPLQQVLLGSHSCPAWSSAVNRGHCRLALGIGFLRSSGG
jgi:hypothetical protein